MYNEIWKIYSLAKLGNIVNISVLYNRQKCLPLASNFEPNELFSFFALLKIQYRHCCS